MSTNPYESPPSDDPDSREPRVRTVEESLIALPAAGLIATSILSIVMLLLGIALHLYLFATGQMVGNAPWSGIDLEGILKARMVYFVLSLLFNAAVLHGALQMRRLKNYQVAESICMLACVPCCSPCVVLGIPFGIWGLMMLRDRQVKEAFKS